MIDFLKELLLRNTDSKVLLLITNRFAKQYSQLNLAFISENHTTNNLYLGNLLTFLGIYLPLVYRERSSEKSKDPIEENHGLFYFRNFFLFFIFSKNHGSFYFQNFFNFLYFHSIIYFFSIYHLTTKLLRIYHTTDLFPAVFYDNINKIEYFCNII